MPVMVDVGMQVSPEPASETPVSSAVSVSEGPMLGLATLAIAPWVSLAAR